MNEAGLYIWEMNENADYPKNDSLPKLNKMNWMQFILDSYSTVDEAIQCALEVEIEGRSWHYFVGDAQGIAWRLHLLMLKLFSTGIRRCPFLDYSIHIITGNLNY